MLPSIFSHLSQISGVKHMLEEQLSWAAPVEDPLMTLGRPSSIPRAAAPLGGLHLGWRLEAAGLGPALLAVPGLWERVVSW